MAHRRQILLFIATVLLLFLTSSLYVSSSQNKSTKGVVFLGAEKKHALTRWSHSESAEKPDLVVNDASNFIEVQKAIQEQRRKMIADTCRGQRPRSTMVLQNPPPNILVNHDHRLLFCYVPKVASTSWKRVFGVLKGLVDRTDNISQFEINRQIKKKLDHLSQQSFWRRRRALTTYTKIMMARNPLSRVLSAYSNKLSPNTTFARAARWQEGLGRNIMKRYHHDDPVYDLSFTDFIHFLGEGRSLRGQTNQHWNELYKACRPCDIHYDIIGKYETLTIDAEFILQTLGLKDIVDFPSANGSSPTNSTDRLEQYYSQVPTDYVRRLYERYKLDFQLFGYDPPI